MSESSQYDDHPPSVGSSIYVVPTVGDSPCIGTAVPVLGDSPCIRSSLCQAILGRPQVNPLEPQSRFRFGQNWLEIKLSPKRECGSKTVKPYSPYQVPGMCHLTGPRLLFMLRAIDQPIFSSPYDMY